MSPAFADSGVLMSPALRSVKASSVSMSLRSSGSYRSDQGRVWQEIARLSDSAAVRSPTHAMKDVYDSRIKDLDEYLRAFPYLPGQKELLVFVDGQPVGCDLVSRESACRVLHPKLVKSYVIDAILKKDGEGGQPSADAARAFLERAAASQEHRYQSVGSGHDYRFEHPEMVGSALVSQDGVIHLAFFRSSGQKDADPMAGYRRRMAFRT